MARHISSFFLFYGIYLITLGKNVETKSGPFISTLLRAEKCTNPSRPWQKDLSGDVTLQMYKMGKKSMLRGNFTSYKPDSGLKLTIQDYLLVNEQRQLTFRVADMSCHGRVVGMMGRLFGIKFDKKSCSVPKGVYVFNNIDYDFVDHVFFISQEYGRVLRKVEAFSKKGTTVCLEFEAAVTPKNK